MDILDHFIKIQDSMFKKLNKSFSKLNKKFSDVYKQPSCEISQSKDVLVIKFGLLEMSKRDISIHVTHDYLEVFAEKKGKRERKLKKMYEGEKSYRGYKRIIPLPPGLVTDKAHAKFSKDKLTVKIPKIKVGKIKVK